MDDETPGERPSVTYEDLHDGKTPRFVQACGRIGVHEPHAWLSRGRIWCEGGGEPGRSAPPRPDRSDEPPAADRSEAGSASAQPGD